MEKQILSKNLSILESLLGRKIVQIKRQIFLGDLDLKNFEQSADGPIEFKLDDNRSINFFPITSVNSVGIEERCMKRYGESYQLKDVTGNSFWEKRRNIKIVSLKILKSKYASEENPEEFGLQFILENDENFLIEYLNDEEIPDTLRLAEEYLGPICDLKNI